MRKLCPTLFIKHRISSCSAVFPFDMLFEIWVAAILNVLLLLGDNKTYTDVLSLSWTTNSFHVYAWTFLFISPPVCIYNILMLGFDGAVRLWKQNTVKMYPKKGKSNITRQRKIIRSCSWLRWSSFWTICKQLYLMIIVNMR